MNIGHKLNLLLLIGVVSFIGGCTDTTTPTTTKKDTLLAQTAMRIPVKGTDSFTLITDASVLVNQMYFTENGRLISVVAAVSPTKRNVTGSELTDSTKALRKELSTVSKANAALTQTVGTTSQQLSTLTTSVNSLSASNLFLRTQHTKDSTAMLAMNTNITKATTSAGTATTTATQALTSATTANNTASLAKTGADAATLISNQAMATSIEAVTVAKARITMSAKPGELVLTKVIIGTDTAYIWGLHPDILKRLPQ